MNIFKPIEANGKTYFPVNGENPNKVRAIYTGIKRPPKKGEYYLSGAIIQAYKVYNDLESSHYIAERVDVEIKMVAQVKEVNNE